MTKMTTLKEHIQQKILILDGAMGTMLQQADLSPADFGGDSYDGCNEILNITKPDLIREIHEIYLEAGADIIETNTFGATSIVLAEYELAQKVEEINIAAAKLARAAVDRYSTDESPRFVAGSMGPTTKTLSVTGGITFEHLVEDYFDQAKALIEGGVDLLLLETAQDTLNVKAASIGIRRAFNKTNKELPIMISGTIEPMGTTLAGQNIEAFYISLEHLKPISVGLNCATGPEFMRDHVRTLSNLATSAVSCYPNAGLPDENGHYHETPAGLAKKMADFAEQGWLNIAGGCCGTTPAHIKALADTLKDFKPRTASQIHTPAVSGIEPLFLEKDNRPILVGERTNVIGSKKFRELIADEKYEEASEIARSQVKGGAQVIDVCLANPDRDELADMDKFLPFVVKKVKVPLMIDSTDPKVIDNSLKYSQGKAIINSINLEDGEARFAEIAPLIKKYGAAVVVGTIDEIGMAVTKERKLEIAKRSYDLLVNKYRIAAQDIIFDPLVFPVGTGDEAYIGSATETTEGIKLIKQAFPNCQTILGVSNISFGLPPAGREVLNAVFLYNCTQAGLDYAIVNTQKLQRYASITLDEIELANNLLYQTNDNTLTAFTAFYRDKKAKNPEEVIRQLPLEDRLSQYIIEGSKNGLVEDLEEALTKYKPLDIINGPLMQGMETVGRLFNDNQLIVAEVLQSAEAMKEAVLYLEPLMEKTESSLKGKILLATVKGDVHDIGKNLVEIILSNNGYEVINLGIKVTPEQLIKTYQQEKPDVIGLSGLLVKSAQQMMITAQDLKAAGIATPLIVGGAALTRKFTETRIAAEYDGIVLYAKDAMNGLDLLNQLSKQRNDKINDDNKKTVQQNKEKENNISNNYNENNNKIDRQNSNHLTEIKRSIISQSRPTLIPPNYERHILKDYPIDHLQPYINQRMLLGKHLGLKGNVDQLLLNNDQKAIVLKEQLDQLLIDAKNNNLINANGIYQFFPAQSDGDDIIIYDPNNYKNIIERFSFPRQQVAPHLSLSDFVRPLESGEMDSIGFLIVTAGSGIRELANNYKETGEYLRSHMLQATALELAEAFAERVHHIMRDTWGITDSINMTMNERFAAKYQGIRVSFGYPACPNLEDQSKLFKLLKPDDIGIQLTDGYMMEPEASVSAMVFSHPEARYFSI